MQVAAVLFDLDETLIVDDAAVDAALVATGEGAISPTVCDPETLAVDVRRHAADLWQCSPYHTYTLRIGISSTEGLWGGVAGKSSETPGMRSWLIEYRRDAWLGGLRDQGLDEPDLARRLADRFGVERRARHAIYPESESVLEALRGTMLLALVTNGASSLQREKIVASDLAPYFTTVAVSGELGYGKPDREIFDHVLAQLEVDAADAVMVGDKLDRDIAGAKNSGIRAVWINRRHASPVASLPAPDATLSDLRSLPDVLASLP